MKSTAKNQTKTKADAKTRKRMIRAAMKRHLPWDAKDATIETGRNIRCLVADEDHGNDTVLRTDSTHAIASIEDLFGFEGDCLNAWDEELQVYWDRVAEDVGRQLGCSVCADLFDIPAVVLLLEDDD